MKNQNQNQKVKCTCGLQQANCSIVLYVASNGVIHTNIKDHFKCGKHKNEQKTGTTKEIRRTS